MLPVSPFTWKSGDYYRSHTRPRPRRYCYLRGNHKPVPGETLTVQIYDADFHPCAKCQVISNDSVESCCGSFALPVIVIPGNCGANTWSLDVNTSYHDFQGGEPYLVIVSGRDGLAMNECLFNILAVQKPDPFHYVTISQPVTNPGENALRLSGFREYRFGPQEKFLLQISSGSNATLITVVPVVFDGTGYSLELHRGPVCTFCARLVRGQYHLSE